MRKFSILFFIWLTFDIAESYSGPNCQLYLENEACYKACIEAEKAVEHYPGGEAFQQHLLRSIELCPDFAHAYFELSVPYAKTGMMHEWIKIIDKAVELKPEDHLGWRGWYHWFFMNNYEKAIADIDSLDAILDYDIGDTGDARYHLYFLKALCYKQLGDPNKAIHIIESFINSEGYYQRYYDNLHLGVLYLETDQPKKAILEFNKQNQYNEISEAYFYSAKAYLKLNDFKAAIDYMNLALEKYDEGIAMQDSYRQLIDEIYRVDIVNELKGLVKFDFK